MRPFICDRILFFGTIVPKTEQLGRGTLTAEGCLRPDRSKNETKGA